MKRIFRLRYIAATSRRAFLRPPTQPWNCLAKECRTYVAYCTRIPNLPQTTRTYSDTANSYSPLSASRCIRLSVYRWKISFPVPLIEFCQVFFSTRYRNLNKPRSTLPLQLIIESSWNYRECDLSIFLAVCF